MLVQTVKVENMGVDITGEILKFAVIAGSLIAGITLIQILMKNRSRKISYFRIFVQIISEVVLFYIISYPLMLSLVVAIVLLMTLFLGRFFCGWICPFGFYMDAVTLFRKALKIRYLNLSERLNKSLHWLRYVILIVLLTVPFLLAIPITAQTGALALFLLGPFNSVRILLGPLVPVIAPWKTLYESNLNFPYVDQIVHYSAPDYALITVAIFVTLTIAGSFVIRRFWCRFCPTGASVAIINRCRSFKWAPLLHIIKDERKCTHCGICKRVCTVQVTDVHDQKGGKITTSKCMLCLRCVEMCPQESCLIVKAGNKTLLQSKNWLEPETGHV
jgi:ferredoxin-type protein NapH